MSRLTQSLGFLLLGALAAGAGTVVVVYKAGTDRTALQAQATDARTKAEDAIRSSKKVTDEANRKIEAAAQEVAKAQARIKALEEERRLIANAVPLVKTKASANWKEFVSIPLGFTIRIPAPPVDPHFTQTSFDAGWLLITKYEGELVEPERSYLVQNHLLVGTQNETSKTFIIQSNGETKLLVRAYLGSTIKDKTVMDALSTLTFRDK